MSLRSWIRFNRPLRKSQASLGQDTICVSGHGWHEGCLFSKTLLPAVYTPLYTVGVAADAASRTLITS